MNNGIQILTAQNLDINIDKLLAQRNLYSRAKTLNIVLLIGTVLIPISVSLIATYSNCNIDKSWFFITYSILAVIGEKLAERIIARNKRHAASIQEQFDIDVLGISENDTLNIDFAGYDIIRAHSKKAKKNQRKVAKVTDWYSKRIDRLTTNIAVIFCQRTNICYDFSVRKKYSNALVAINLLTFLLLFLVSLSGDFTLRKFLIEVIFPLVPAFLFTYKEVTSNNESTDNLKILKVTIEAQISNLTLSSSVDADKIRRLQDRIYMNRLYSPLIPDFIYKMLWSKLEDEMNYSVENRINELK